MELSKSPKYFLMTRQWINKENWGDYSEIFKAVRELKQEKSAAGGLDAAQVPATEGKRQNVTEYRQKTTENWQKATKNSKKMIENSQEMTEGLQKSLKSLSNSANRLWQNLSQWYDVSVSECGLNDEISINLKKSNAGLEGFGIRRL